MIPWYQIRSDGAQRSSSLSANTDAVAQQEGSVILLEFLLVTLSQCVLFKTLRGNKKKRQQAWELRQRGVWWVFLFFPLLTDGDKCSNPKTWRWEGHVCACAFYQLENHWMYLLPRRSARLVTEESKIISFCIPIR